MTVTNDICRWWTGDEWFKGNNCLPTLKLNDHRMELMATGSFFSLSNYSKSRLNLCNSLSLYCYNVCQVWTMSTLHTLPTLSLLWLLVNCAHKRGVERIQSISFFRARCTLFMSSLAGNLNGWRHRGAFFSLRNVHCFCDGSVLWILWKDYCVCYNRTLLFNHQMSNCFYFIPLRKSHLRFLKLQKLVFAIFFRWNLQCTVADFSLKHLFFF